eukprot:SAG22_NODE_964_length_6277_cov_12.416316_5_plen_365_part_00
MEEITVKSLARVTIGGAFSDDLKRFKLKRDGLTITKLREELFSQHRGNLPGDFVIKYEWVSGKQGLSALTTDEQLANAVKVLCDGGSSNSAGLPLRLYVSAEKQDTQVVQTSQGEAPAREAQGVQPGGGTGRDGIIGGGGGGAGGGAGGGGGVGGTPPHNLPSASVPTSALSAAPFISQLPDTPPPVGARDKELVYKIMVVGNAACGKTSIINRYVNDVFAENYKSTVGADFSRKIIQWDDHTTIRLQLWDIAGQDRFAAVTRAFYRNAVGAVVVCDVTRTTTLDAVKQWKAEIDSKVTFKGGAPIPAVLLVNKIDLLTNIEDSFSIGASYQRVCASLRARVADGLLLSCCRKLSRWPKRKSEC